MSKPRVVVCLADPRDFLQDEVRAIAGRLRPTFEVTFVTAAPDFGRAATMDVKLAVVVSQGIIDVRIVDAVTARSVSSRIFVATEAARTQLERTRRLPPNTHWIVPEQVPPGLAGVMAEAMIHDLLARVRWAVAKSSLFARFKKLATALQQALAPTPDRFVVASVEKLASLAKRTTRWANWAWVEVGKESDDQPQLKEFLIAIVFVKALRLLLMGESPKECINHLGVGRRTFEDHIKAFTGRSHAEIDTAELPAVIIEVERDYLAWVGCTCSGF